MIDEVMMNALKALQIKNINTKHISKIGEGAWHVVYRIERQFEKDIVLRMKKKVAYGQLQEYKEEELITEYESTKAYYQYANQCSSNICPSYFDYYLDQSLVFTTESFMGKGRTLLDLSFTEAFSIGEKLGVFFQNMHGKTPVIKGFGSLKWNGKHLEGKVQQDSDRIWLDDNDFYISALNKLIGTDLNLDTKIIADKIIRIVEERRKNPQKVSLVNQDITPENIIIDLDNVAIIDPLPKLDFDLKYAGYFFFCYKFLLPAYSNAPRYWNNSYSQYADKLGVIADGFINGYARNDASLIKKIMTEYILWVLLETCEHFEVLNEENVSYKTLQQMGDKEVIKNRLILCLKELESSCLTM